MQLLLTIVLLPIVYAYTAVPRWGQAVAVVNDALFVHGGKVDQFNEQYYTSSPNTNDLLFLSLAEPFDVAYPPWELVSSSSNASTSQGPALSWHSISAVNTSTLLLFGGQPGPNSPTVITDNADSAFLIDVLSPLAPSWLPQPQGWANEPARRIYHSTVTLPDGRVVIIGGIKADGSSLTFPRNWIFDVNMPSFSIFNLENGPVDIYGHVSLILPDGRVVVFGGCSPNSLNPLTTIWILDTSNWTWSVITITSSPVPDGRRAFAAVVLPDGRILIHGGGDRDLQTSYSDGWILDPSQNPPMWTRIPALDQLGPRRDHFAVAYGSQVIFGFGYSSNGPAPADLRIYDVEHDDFPISFTPPPPPSPSYTPTTHGTLPGATPTKGHPNAPSGKPPVGTGKPGGNNGGNGGGDGGGGDGNGGGGGEEGDRSKSKKTTAIAIGTVFGVLALLAAGAAALYYVKRRQRQRDLEFSPLDGEDDSPQHPHGIPAAGVYQEKNGRVGAVLASIGLRGRNSDQLPERRDMLADEDTRQFGTFSPYTNLARDSSTGSSWSLKNLFTGARGGKSREPSSTSAGNSLLGTPWREKTDPFSDGSALMRDEETGFVGAAAPGAIAIGAASAVRPRGGRQSSYSSTHSTQSNADPFADPDAKEPKVDYNAPYLDAPPHPPPLRTMLPLGMEASVLSPLSEHDSRTSLSDPSRSVSSHDHLSQSTSFDASPRPSSIIDANPGGSLVRRSDSWWSRFATTSLLARRHSDASQRSRPLDIRDPHPAPRLGPIEETGHSASSPDDSPQSALAGAAGRSASLSRARSKMGTGEHRKSLSSLQTANSEALEQAAGMDVAQRMGSGSHRTRSSLGSSITAEDHVDDLLDIRAYASPTEISHDQALLVSAIAGPSKPLRASSPTSIRPTPAISSPKQSPNVSPGSSNGSLPDRPPSGTSVASRVQEYERRLSQSTGSPSPPLSVQEERSPRKKSVTINYGLVPRPSLYVANPDHAPTASG